MKEYELWASSSPYSEVVTSVTFPHSALFLCVFDLHSFSDFLAVPVGNNIDVSDHPRTSRRVLELELEWHNKQRLPVPLVKSPFFLFVNDCAFSVNPKLSLAIKPPRSEHNYEAAKEAYEPANESIGAVG